MLASTFLLQILQAGYPKLLRIFHDLFERIVLVDRDVSYYYIHLRSENNPFMKILVPFEAAYISRSLTRLLDSVNSAFPEKSSKTFSSKDDVEKLCRTFSGFFKLTLVNLKSLNLIQLF